ncbi:hypothetical protein EW145_g2378 [Phellinidium pouzarii]|uniref:Torus domain-containing protein n=1 Tax=Phellinidium pouzarii TaxID=167371 RepID=A0A4S4LCN4_9AGAM|nr:hypothetical protein EW145_g2378 [Phellinidium pouzarii]
MSTNTETQVATTTTIVKPPLTTLKPPKKLKPARKQVKPGDVEKKETPQTGKEYNIWYNKWAGGDREDSYSKHAATLSETKDSRAQIQPGFDIVVSFFARGCCPYGWECEYLHMLPDASWALPDSSKDCFARDKFVDYRDDMGGVGSFSRQNRTLYVGRVKEMGPGPDTEEIFQKLPRAYARISVRVLQYRSVAFVTYVSELNAQFAKEAMACQSLDNDEILNVRWATEDPNPTSKVAEQERIEDMGRKAIQERMDPRIVDAMRAVRALEDGEELKDEEPDVEDEQRRELEALAEDSNDDDGPPSTKRRRLDAPESNQPIGLLSTDTIEGLKYFAEIRKRHENTQVVKQTAPPKPLTSSLALDYGSDDE